MQDFKKLLCPTDFSESSFEAMRYAVGLARTLGAEIEVLHVHHVPLHEVDMHAPKSVQDLSEALRIELTQRLDELKLDLEVPDVKVCTRLAVGVPHEVINDAAKHTADMIVMSTAGHSGLSRVLFGGVTERVLRRAERPVLTLLRK